MVVPRATWMVVHWAALKAVGSDDLKVVLLVVLLVPYLAALTAD